MSQCENQMCIGAVALEGVVVYWVSDACVSCFLSSLFLYELLFDIAVDFVKGGKPVFCVLAQSHMYHFVRRGVFGE